MHNAMDGQGYVDDAVDALGSASVYVSSEVADAASLRDQLAQQIGDESIGVAVFSDNAALEASGPDIVSELAAAHPGTATIIVAVGDDLSAGSRVLAPGEAMRVANEAEVSAPDVDAALTETIQGVIALTPDAPSPGGADAGPFVGIAVGAAVLLAAGGALFGVMRSRRRRTRGAAVRHPLPDPVRTHVQTLQILSAEYAHAGAGGIAQAGEVSADVGRIASHTTELFDRLDRKGEEGQRATAAVEYGETLRKLTGALDRDYLLDILIHPDLWDDPAERIDEVRSALSAFSLELVENIKQVNARRGLHFQVSLDGLIGRRKELREWDREFERAAGDEPGSSSRPGSDD
ncbi:hypothetical protein MK786_06090 [Microbacterium sp. CFH 31415]|uniref:hypothetical protein n=1 Tax=Microbacterium sp. CFH 31415 TaxID=2921732 RepID=UPI001F13ABC4|nr:hypothetical protein [Microbacterium sp. CFH 31415]MCH6230303.1 hypothetical protein [Microbacterium sp. CFH 31415]